jgi:endoglucanase
MMQNTDIAVSFVDATTIQLRMELGEVNKAAQTTTIPPGGEVRNDDYYYVDGRAVGRLGGINGEYFMPFDTLSASDIADLFKVTNQNGTLQALVDNPDDWTVTVNGEVVDVTIVSRKSHILDTARTDVWAHEFASTENVFLELSRPLTEGDDIRITFNDTDFDAQAAKYAPATTISEAIHVNLRGFDPDDAHKVAYLSSWNGWQVDGSIGADGRAIAQEFAPGTEWQVVNSTTGQVVQTGVIEMFNTAETPTNFSTNYQGTDVWKIDFSALDDEGTFHVVVDGVGRSNDFALSDNQWDSVFELGMSGYYHQRSGIALEDPYTNWDRPRSIHPEDGFTIYETTLKITDTNMGYDFSKPDPFSQFASKMTGATVDDAWGGWHDAGDFDRRTQHIETVRKMIELWELDPAYQEMVHLSVPEGGDGIPDVLNEGLWTLDMFRRLQNDAGGVSGGIESEEHPRYGDGSWGESLRVFAYAPDVWTTWEYAAAAAKMARALEKYDPELAATYKASAIKAMNWAEANVPVGGEYSTTLENSRNIAAVEMFALTGASQWNALYAETSAYNNGPNVQWFEHQHEAAFVYQRLTQAGVDADLQKAGFDALMAEAENYATNFGRGGFGSTINPYAPYGWGTSATAMEEAADYYVRAHALTGDARWITEALADAQYLLGANPLNMAFLTGLGAREPETILNVDAETMGSGPPPGITVYGDYNIRDHGYGWFNGVMDPAVWPNFYDIPVSESFNAFRYFVPATEYTVMQGMQDTFFVTGYLASLAMEDAVIGTAGVNRMMGTATDDILRGEGGDDRINGANGDDRAAGGVGNDSVYGGTGDDTLFGDDGNDRLNGQDGNDILLGGNGNDILQGWNGNDVLVGGDGNDTLSGYAGNDTLLGSAGADSLRGLDGNDFLGGEAGNDILRGGVGDDILAGGEGADRMHGGAGIDIFIFRTGDGADRIDDFEKGIDRIKIEADGTAAELAALGRFNASGQVFTLDLDDGDVLTLISATRFTQADVAAALDIV